MHMNHRSATLLNAGLVAAIFAVAFWATHDTPAGGRVAIHWGSDSRPDTFLRVAAVHLINPIVALVLWFLLTMAPQGFSSRGQAPSTAHARVTGLFLAQLVIQLCMAIYVKS